jgi:hypothetical protein
MLTRPDPTQHTIMPLLSDSTQITASMNEASAKLRGQRPKHLDLPHGADERSTSRGVVDLPPMPKKVV